MLWHTCDLFLSPMKKIVCRTETNTIFTVFENSVSYSVSVERNRHNSETVGVVFCRLFSLTPVVGWIFPVLAAHFLAYPCYVTAQ